MVSISRLISPLGWSDIRYIIPPQLGIQTRGHCRARLLDILFIAQPSFRFILLYLYVQIKSAATVASYDFYSGRLIVLILIIHMA